MIVEITQLLSTAWHVLDDDFANELLEEGAIYKKTHINHPCAIWVREHLNNYLYTVKLGLELCKEWRRRYAHPRSKIHGCELKLKWLLSNPPLSIDTSLIELTRSNPKGFTLPMPLAMPDQYRSKKGTVKSCVRSYRRYYKSPQKSHIAQWYSRDVEYTIKPPMWW